MAKVVMTCGKICSGKSTYAAKLCSELNGVILSIDELTLALFNNEAGDKLDMYVERARSYLYKQSVRLIRAGVNVVLDWGFWTREDRRDISTFLTEHETDYEWHYINISDERWKRNIMERNARIEQGNQGPDFYVNEGLLQKLESLFVPPEENEVDVIYTREE